MNIKDNIKAICKVRGRTFAQLANDLNITRQTLFRQLTGNTTTDTLKRIADRLNVPPFILLHPDPARAMKEADGRQDYRTAGGIQTGPGDPDNPGTQAQPRPAPSYPAPVRLLCPCCNSTLLLSIQPAEEGRTNNNQDHNQQSDAGKDNNGQKTNKPTDEQGPEEMKLF